MEVCFEAGPRVGLVSPCECRGAVKALRHLRLPCCTVSLHAVSSSRFDDRHGRHARGGWDEGGQA
eukprot:6190931-Pleurochrysis_carterae.AAC.1